MPYYEKDAKLVHRLRERIEALGMPMVIGRKFSGILSAIEMQVEQDYAVPEVVDTLFIAVLQMASVLRDPECSTITNAVQECREQLAKRLLKRGD